jgi:hypothetical protein
MMLQSKPLQGETVSNAYVKMLTRQLVKLGGATLYMGNVHCTLTFW